MYSSNDWVKVPLLDCMLYCWYVLDFIVSMLWERLVYSFFTWCDSVLGSQQVWQLHNSINVVTDKGLSNSKGKQENLSRTSIFVYFWDPRPFWTKMVCISCIVIPVVLWLWHRFLQPIFLKFWNPWQPAVEKTSIQTGTFFCYRIVLPILLIKDNVIHICQTAKIFSHYLTLVSLMPSTNYNFWDHVWHDKNFCWRNSKSSGMNKVVTNLKNRTATLTLHSYFRWKWQCFKHLWRKP